MAQGAGAMMLGALLPRKADAETSSPSDQGANDLAAIYHDYTQTYQKYSANDQIEMREAMCLDVLYPATCADLRAGDLFAGRRTEPAVGFMPQPTLRCGGVGYFFDDSAIEGLMKSRTLSAQNRENLANLRSFWPAETTKAKIKDSYPPAMQTALPSDDYSGSAGCAFPLYRMSGSQLDYEKLLRLGVSGLKDEIAAYQARTASDTPAFKLYAAMLQALETFTKICNHYATLATTQADRITGAKRKAELNTIATILKKIALARPDTLREAIQLSYLYCRVAGSINFGRMDDYLGDFYANDLTHGTLTEEGAITLLCSLWKMIDEHGSDMDSRVWLGGLGRSHEANANRFALIALETTRRLIAVKPVLSLRFYKGQDPALMTKALDLLAAARTFPILYNDDVNVPAVMSAFNVTRDVAVNYLGFGCGEYMLNHQSFGTPSGVINLLAVLTEVLHGGVNYDTFAGLYAAYNEKVEYYVKQLAIQEKLEYDIAAKQAPYLFLSMLYDDCIATGKTIFAGGIRYLGGTLEAYGNTNTADSLLAIKNLVYDQQKLSFDKLVAILKANFSGYEAERNWMLNCPKYGNDNAEADAMKVDVDRHICSFTRDQAAVVGLHSYLIVIINNNTNCSMGAMTGASPDGRQAHTFMANGNAPMNGADKNGVTAFLNSIVKPDVSIHAGAVQNMMFSRKAFAKYRPRVESMLAAYWANGGAQAMINVLGSNDLKNALENPSHYGNLIVRVGGYSDRFVNIPPNIQKEIISRTFYAESKLPVDSRGALDLRKSPGKSAFVTVDQNAHEIKLSVDTDHDVAIQIMDLRGNVITTRRTSKGVARLKKGTFGPGNYVARCEMPQGVRLKRLVVT